MHAKYSTLWIFWGFAGWKLRLRPLRFFYVQLKVSQTSNLIYVVLWAPRHDIAARCPSAYGTWQSQAVTHPNMNRARRCLTSVIEPTPMRERRVPYSTLVFRLNYQTVQFLHSLISSRVKTWHTVMNFVLHHQVVSYIKIVYFHSYNGSLLVTG